MKIRLMVKGECLGLGDETGLFEWKGSTCLVGRSECELTVTDPYCSQRHALIYQGTRGELRLRDLDSTNGTFVSGHKVADTVLHIGDEIRIGKTFFNILSFRADRFSGSLDLAIKDAELRRENTSFTKTRQTHEPYESDFPALRKAS